jgi:hypothetical protein
MVETAVDRGKGVNLIIYLAAALQTMFRRYTQQDCQAPLEGIVENPERTRKSCPS